jgi:hypothetical protein
MKDLRAEEVFEEYKALSREVVFDRVGILQGKVKNEKDFARISIKLELLKKIISAIEKQVEVLGVIDGIDYNEDIDYTIVLELSIHRYGRFPLLIKPYLFGGEAKPLLNDTFFAIAPWVGKEGEGEEE